jgi:hypothetical protein
MVFEFIAKNKRFLLLLSLLILSSNSWAQVNLQFSKPITMGGYICATPWSGGCSGYQLSAGDTVPAGKIWKIVFIGAGGSTALYPRFAVNGAELNGWSTANKQMWASPQPIWLNSGDRFAFYSDNCGHYGTSTLTMVVNVLEFNKGSM